MPRIGRVVVPGYRHYVRQIAESGAELFRDESEAGVFAKKLRELAVVNGSEILAVTIWKHRIDTLVVAANRNSLARIVGEASRQFSRYVVGRKASPFPKRFLSCPVDEDHAQAALRIMSVASGEVLSSFGMKILLSWSESNNKKNLSPKNSLVGIGGDILFALEKAEAEMRLGVAVRTGRPAGDRAFLRRVERLLNRRLRVGRRGRPAAHSLLFEETEK